MALVALKVDCTLLAQAVTLLPSSCRVVGSERSEHSWVRLLLEAPHLAPECKEVTMVVHDVEGTRTVSLVAIEG